MDWRSVLFERVGSNFEEGGEMSMAQFLKEPLAVGSNMMMRTVRCVWKTHNDRSEVTDRYEWL